VRFRAEERLRFDRDAFLTLEAGAPLDADRRAWLRERSGVYSETLAPGFVPLAFSNPIFVDVDGNGRFDPIGRPLAVQSDPVPAAVVAATLALLLGLWWLRRRRVA
jgi:MYXO-CTERM domain-containing protein